MVINNRKAADGKPSPQTQCEVCNAARRLVLATDQIRTAEYAGTVTDALRASVVEARKVWTFARLLRHTGTVHTPVVAP